jgi:hypothetical protein
MPDGFKYSGEQKRFQSFNEVVMSLLIIDSRWQNFMNKVKMV